MIEVDRKDGLWTVTLDRPEKANSLTGEMLSDLVEIAEAATEARALILTGRGKVFSAGADLEEAKTGGLATSDLWEKLSGAIAVLPCLTVAALNGTLAGRGERDGAGLRSAYRRSLGKALLPGDETGLSAPAI